MAAPFLRECSLSVGREPALQPPVDLGDLAADDGAQPDDRDGEPRGARHVGEPQHGHHDLESAVEHDHVHGDHLASQDVVVGTAHGPEGHHGAADDGEGVQDAQADAQTRRVPVVDHRHEGGAERECRVGDAVGVEAVGAAQRSEPLRGHAVEQVGSPPEGEEQERQSPPLVETVVHHRPGAENAQERQRVGDESHGDTSFVVRLLFIF